MRKKVITTEARVIVTTDIHGCHDALLRLLEKVDFSDKDVLIIAGDAIDRGPDSEEVVRFIASKPNVHCILGNHEDMALKAFSTGEPVHLRHFVQNGGSWLLDKDADTIKFVLDEIATYPEVIEIRKGGKVYGVVHAQPDTDDWNTVGTESQTTLIWGRDRLYKGKCNFIANVEEIYTGHSIVDHPTYTGNVLHMDMGAFLGNELFHVEI